MATHEASGGLRLVVSCLCVSGTLLGFGGAAEAKAMDCTPMTVEANRALLAAWPELPGQIEERFAARRAIDPCARIRLEQSQGAISVEVSLSDGRVASRTVAHADDVIPILEALLQVPEPESTVEVNPGSQSAAMELSAGDPSPPLATTPAKDEQSDRVRDAEPEHSPRDGTATEKRRRVGIELSALADARAGDLPTSFGVGVRPLVELWRLLLGVEVRARGNSAATTTEVSALAGYRFPLGSLELDVLVGACAELPGPNTSSTAPAAMQNVPPPRADSEPWFYFGSHLRFAPSAALSAFTGLEATLGVVGPEDNGAGRALDSNLWMGGVVLGATVGTQ